MIETDRLIIRQFTNDDYQDLYEYLSIPGTYEYEPGEPITLDEAKKLAAERAAGADFWAVILKDNNKLIGHLYFKQMEPKKIMTWELGYIFNPRYHGNGYASEAARAKVLNAFHSEKAHRVMAGCNPKNAASWKLLEKIGFRREGHFKKCGTFKDDDAGNPIWHDAYEYGILEEDLRK